MTALRVMTWNLLEGGHVPGQRPPQIDAGRTKAAQQLIERLDPDIVILNEALWAEPYDGYHCDYAQTLGFAHACARLYDGAWGNAILSRHPIVACQDFRIYNRGGLISTIASPTGHLQVGTYHPHPSRYPFNKASDYRAVVKAADPRVPLVIGGDFNAISPADAPDHSRLTEAFAAFSPNPGPDSARFIDGGVEVFDALTAAGMVDGVPPSGRQPTIPTRLISSSQDSGMRIDHLWVNDRVHVIDGWVEQAPEADAASDHYPVLLDIALRR